MRLLIMRHAKSSWDDPAVRDFDRPLNQRGHHAAPRMGQRLHVRGIAPDLILSSPARRAHATAALVAGELGYASHNIQLEPRIYEAERDTLLDLVQHLAPHHHEVLLCGHNPGLHALAECLISSRHLWHFPTGAVACVSFDLPTWQAVVCGAGTLQFFDFPKNDDSPV